MDVEGEGRCMETVTQKFTTPYVKWTQMGIRCVPQELKQGLCDRLKSVVGREIRGAVRREGDKKKKGRCPCPQVFRL